VELGGEVGPEEVPGLLELDGESLVFTPRDQGRRPTRIPFRQIAKVRRLRGSPVLMVLRATPEGKRRTAFYFAQPPPLGALRHDAVERPTGLLAFRSPRKKARRQNVGYLGVMNREKKATLAQWVQALRAALDRSDAAPEPSPES
jgi:hypothetical protein